jgi:ABC-type nitrate/sulfonate/bicarbonate transport system substrate-binding protein
MRSRRSLLPSRLGTAGLLLALLLCLPLAACGSDDSSGAANEQAGAAGTSDAGKDPVRVRLALDWVPNVNHTGFFVADAKGYYDDAGIEFDVLPYSQAPADTVVSAGKAECGVTFPHLMAVAIGKGAKERAVMGVVQRPLGSITVLAGSKYQQLKDLDGGTYGGFGSPGDAELIKALIQHGGGKGEFRYVNLQTGTLEALMSKKVDFVNLFLNVEPFEAEERGVEIRAFPYTEAGIPEFPNVVIACNPDWLAENGDAAKRFVEASSEGWQFAQDSPAEAANILAESNRGSFGTDKAKAVAAKGLQFMADNDYIVRDGSAPGCLSMDDLNAMGDRFEEVGYWKATGLKQKPDYGEIATTEYLPAGC